MENIICGNNIDVIKDIEDCSIDCVVTSPPYYMLRDYGTGTWVGGDVKCDHKYHRNISKCTTGHKSMAESGVALPQEFYSHVCKKCGAIRVDNQLGMEKTPEEYVEKLVLLFRGIKRTLKDDGTVWLNIGDTYSKKSLTGIPWMVAMALAKDGWYLRQDIIWHKPNPMPESVQDRFTKSHEYIFLLSKSEKYYFNHKNAQQIATGYDNRKSIQHHGSAKYINENIMPDSKPQSLASGSHDRWKFNNENVPLRNMRDVWTIPTKPFNGAHFATFPEKLVERCIKIGCKQSGTVLDPFNGAATVGVVCKKLGIDYIGIELNPEYVEISKNRLAICMETDNYEISDKKIIGGKVNLFD